jgi:hypothetical protein
MSFFGVGDYFSGPTKRFISNFVVQIPAKLTTASFEHTLRIFTECPIMSKRPAESHENVGVSLKDGDRQEKPSLEDEVGEFEDEFEDEYESEDEILEAGVDGRPDAEREAEEKAGMRI